MSISVKGKRDNLQAFLDDCIAMEPAAQVMKYNWQQNSKTENEYGLTVSLNFYMYEN